MDEQLKAVPEDLWPHRAGHGYEAGCECDLEGGDEECKVQPPYEQTGDYCERLRNRVMTAELALSAAKEEIARLTGLANYMEKHIDEYEVDYAKAEVKLERSLALIGTMELAIDSAASLEELRAKVFAPAKETSSHESKGG